MQGLLGEEWKEGYAIERVRFEGVRAAHFVAYGCGGRRGWTGWGRGWGDWVRGREVDVLVGVLGVGDGEVDGGVGGGG